jgi:hypothetical protein
MEGSYAGSYIGVSGHKSGRGSMDRIFVLAGVGDRFLANRTYRSYALG